MQTTDVNGAAVLRRGTLTFGVVSGLMLAMLTTLAPTTAGATTTPGAAPLPKPLQPGTWTAPLFPIRDLPAFATPTHVAARTRGLDGRADVRINIATPAGSTLVWGDWDRDGAYTPGLFTSGHWVLYNTVIGSTPLPAAEFDFGAPGDKPVVGDFNRDGRTDVGVVRGNSWSLRNAPSAGPTKRHFRFGRANDVPVTGDWDGNGRDGIGVRRGNQLFLVQAPRAAKPTYTLAFGRRSDQAVIGDWDGDGSDSIGAVRGSTWFLRSTVAKVTRPGMKKKARLRAERAAVSTRTILGPKVPGTVPTPWPTPSGPSGAACPTASAAVSNRPAAAPLVVPSALLDKNLPYDPANPNLGADPAFQVRSALLESERYLLGAQYIERWYTQRREVFTDLLARFSPDQQEYAVRRPAMAALTTAVAARTRAHNDSIVGRTTDEAVQYSDWLVRSIACQHVAVTPGGWGGGWQTAHWAMLAGQAAWLIWDRLTPQTREYVAQMLVYEADRLLTMPVEYWADAAGTVVSRGNTHAEDDSWNAALLELAVNMMPRHPQAKNWRRKAVDLETAAYARFSDLSSGAVVNGFTLADRLDGANAYDDGTVENHGVIQPDYMTNIQQSWWAADFAGLANRKAPLSALHNAMLVYGAFSTVSFPEGGASPANGASYAAPGGTIYRTGGNDIYFPQATIWGTLRRAQFVSFDAHAYAYGLDQTAAWPARDALAAHVGGQLGLTAANGTGDGRTYNFDPPTADSQDTYNGREEYAASQVAAGWLALYVSRNAWDQQFNLPGLDDSAYAPLPPLSQADTGWFSRPKGTSPQDERLSP